MTCAGMWENVLSVKSDGNNGKQIPKTVFQCVTRSNLKQKSVIDGSRKSFAWFLIDPSFQNSAIANDSNWNDLLNLPEPSS